MTPEFWSVSRLACEFAMDRRTIARRLVEIEPVKAEGRIKYYRMKDAAPLLIAGTTDAAGQDSAELQIAILRHRERLAFAQAEGAEKRNRVRDGELCERDATWQEFADVMMDVRTAIMQVPNIIAPHLEQRLTAHAAASIVSTRLWEAFNRVARYGLPIADPETGDVLERDSKVNLAAIALSDGIGLHYLLAACTAYFGGLDSAFDEEFELSTVPTKSISEATQIREIARCFFDALEDRPRILVKGNDHTKLAHVKQISYPDE